MPISVQTRWSLVQAAKGDTEQSRAALAELCEIYYEPILKQIRRWVLQEDAARDLTQSFFARLLSGSQIETADATKGSFRAYLHAATRNFVLAQWRAKMAEKRGMSVTDEADFTCDAIADHSQRTPDMEFDRAWACALLKRSLDVLEAEMTSAGRPLVFTTLKPWLAGDASHGETALAAQTLGVSETAVRVHLSRLRKRMRGILEQTLADTLAVGANVQQELQALKAALQ